MAAAAQREKVNGEHKVCCKPGNANGEVGLIAMVPRKYLEKGHI